MAGSFYREMHELRLKYERLTELCQGLQTTWPSPKVDDVPAECETAPENLETVERDMQLQQLERILSDAQKVRNEEVALFLS